MKAETARIGAHGLQLEVELEMVRRHAAWGPRRLIQLGGKKLHTLHKRA